MNRLAAKFCLLINLAICPIGSASISYPPQSMPLNSLLRDKANLSDRIDWDGILLVNDYLRALAEDGWSSQERKLLASMQGQAWQLLVYDVADLTERNNGDLSRAQLMLPDYEGKEQFFAEYKKAYREAMSREFMQDAGSFADDIFAIRSHFTSKSLISDRMVTPKNGEVRYTFKSNESFLELVEMFRRQGKLETLEQQIKNWWKDTPYLDKSFYEVYGKDNRLDWKKTWAFFSDDELSVVQPENDYDFSPNQKKRANKYLAAMNLSFDYEIRKYVIHPTLFLTSENESEIKQHLNSLHADFLNDLAGIKQMKYAFPQDKLTDQVRAILTFSRKLIYAHPFSDGNGRIFTNILVRQLLAENNLPQSLFNPQWIGNSFLTIDQLTDHVIEGMDRFNKVSLQRRPNSADLILMLDQLKFKIRSCGK